MVAKWLAKFYLKQKGPWFDLHTQGAQLCFLRDLQLSPKCHYLSFYYAILSSHIPTCIKVVVRVLGQSSYRALGGDRGHA